MSRMVREDSVKRAESRLIKEVKPSNSWTKHQSVQLLWKIIGQYLLKMYLPYALLIPLQIEMCIDEHPKTNPGMFIFIKPPS